MMGLIALSKHAHVLVAILIIHLITSYVLAEETTLNPIVTNPELIQRDLSDIIEFEDQKYVTVESTVHEIYANRYKSAINEYLKLKDTDQIYVIVGKIYSNDVENLTRILEFIDHLPDSQQAVVGFDAVFHEILRRDDWGECHLMKMGYFIKKFTEQSKYKKDKKTFVLMKQRSITRMESLVEKLAVDIQNENDDKILEFSQNNSQEFNYYLKPLIRTTLKSNLESLKMTFQFSKSLAHAEQILVAFETMFSKLQKTPKLDDKMPLVFDFYLEEFMQEPKYLKFNAENWSRYTALKDGLEVYNKKVIDRLGSYINSKNYTYIANFPENYSSEFSFYIQRVLEMVHRNGSEYVRDCLNFVVFLPSSDQMLIGFRSVYDQVTTMSDMLIFNSYLNKFEANPRYSKLSTENRERYVFLKSESEEFMQNSIDQLVTEISQNNFVQMFDFVANYSSEFSDYNKKVVQAVLLDGSEYVKDCLNFQGISPNSDQLLICLESVFLQIKRNRNLSEYHIMIFSAYLEKFRRDPKYVKLDQKNRNRFMVLKNESEPHSRKIIQQLAKNIDIQNYSDFLEFAENDSSEFNGYIKNVFEILLKTNSSDSTRHCMHFIADLPNPDQILIGFRAAFNQLKKNNNNMLIFYYYLVKFEEGIKYSAFQGEYRKRYLKLKNESGQLIQRIVEKLAGDIKKRAHSRILEFAASNSDEFSFYIPLLIESVHRNGTKGVKDSLSFVVLLPTPDEMLIGFRTVLDETKMDIIYDLWTRVRHILILNYFFEKFQDDAKYFKYTSENTKQYMDLKKESVSQIHNATDELANEIKSHNYANILDFAENYPNEFSFYISMVLESGHVQMDKHGKCGSDCLNFIGHLPYPDQIIKGFEIIYEQILQRDILIPHHMLILNSYLEKFEKDPKYAKFNLENKNRFLTLRKDSEPYKVMVINKLTKSIDNRDYTEILEFAGNHLFEFGYVMKFFVESVTRSDIDNLEKVYNFAEVLLSKKGSMIIFEILSNEMQTNNNTKTYQALMLGCYIKKSMNQMKYSKYSSFNEYVKSQFTNLRKNLPDNVKNLLWNQVCLQSTVGVQQSLYGAVSTFSESAKRRRILVGNVAGDTKFGWRFETSNNCKTFLLKNSHFDEYLQANNITYQNERRQVFSGPTTNSSVQAGWKIDAVRNSNALKIKHAYYNEYLYAHPLNNQVYTAKSCNNCAWHVKSCDALKDIVSVNVETEEDDDSEEDEDEYGGFSR